MNLARVELIIFLLGAFLTTGWASASDGSALSAAAGAALAWLSFASIRAMAVRLVGRRVGPQGAVALALVKWCVIAGALTLALWRRVELDGLALATGVSCLPAAILAETVLFSWRRRLNGTRVHMGG